MMKKLTLLALPLLAAALVVSGGARHVLADDSGDEQESSVQGTLSAAVGPPPTVTVGTQTLAVDSGTRFEISGPATFQQVVAYTQAHPGATADAEYFLLNGQAVAKKVELNAEGDGQDGNGDGNADEQEASGSLVALSAAAGGGRLTLAPGGGAANLNFTLDSHTSYEADCADVTLAQLIALLPTPLPADLGVEVQYVVAPDQSLVATEVHVNLPVSHDDGEVASVDASGSTLVIQSAATRAASRPVRRKYTRVQLLPGTVVTKGARLLTRADLRRGDRVTLSTVVRRHRVYAVRVSVAQ